MKSELIRIVKRQNANIAENINSSGVNKTSIKNKLLQNKRLEIILYSIIYRIEGYSNKYYVMVHSQGRFEGSRPSRREQNFTFPP